MHLTLPPSYLHKTCGLCGTFSNNQLDDYKTSEGIVENSVVTFGNTWKVNPTCPDAHPLVMHPCHIQPQREADAKSNCNMLLTWPFSRCHHELDPTVFINNCIHDVCSCSDGVGCLCASISSYTKACADIGIVIEWRNANVVPVCGKFRII